MLAYKAANPAASLRAVASQTGVSKSRVAQILRKDAPKAAKPWGGEEYLDRWYASYRAEGGKADKATLKVYILAMESLYVPVKLWSERHGNVNRAWGEWVDAIANESGRSLRFATNEARRVFYGVDAITAVS